MPLGPLWSALPTAVRPIIDQASWDAVVTAAGGGPLFAALPTSVKHYIDETNHNAMRNSVPDIRQGSATLDFGIIGDGAEAELTITVAGATVGRPVIAGWPATLTSKLIGMMLVSAADTVQVRILNMSGADVDLAPLAFTAIVVL